MDVNEEFKNIRRQEIIKRWSELGLLEGLSGHPKENIARLYENEASRLLNESISGDTKV